MNKGTVMFFCDQIAPCHLTKLYKGHFRGQHFSYFIGKSKINTSTYTESIYLPKSNYINQQIPNNGMNGETF